MVGLIDQPALQNRSIFSIVTPIQTVKLADYSTSPPFAINRSSLKDNEHFLLIKLHQENSSGRVMGPFKNPPFKNIQVSPLGLVPKKEPGEYRLIHHLSYPDGSSINDGIPYELCTVQHMYQSIHDTILIIENVSVGALLAKTDLENA